MNKLKNRWALEYWIAEVMGYTRKQHFNAQLRAATRSFYRNEARLHSGYESRHDLEKSSATVRFRRRLPDPPGAGRKRMQTIIPASVAF